MPVHASAPEVNGNTVDCCNLTSVPEYSACRSVGVLTQSNAFDSLAQTSGHSRGVMVASGDAAMAARTSDSIDAEERLEAGSVMDVQDSQELVRDLNEPDWKINQVQPSRLHSLLTLIWETRYEA